MADLAVNIAGVDFKNPVWLASGTCGYGEELSEFFDIGLTGAVVTKTVTIEPRKGHPSPRVYETPSGMLNAIGLQNVGIDRFISEKIPFLEEHGATVVVNIAGWAVDEYCRLCEKLTGVSKNIVMIELNMSCPNVDAGMEFSRDAALAEKLVRETKKATDIPIMAKLSPNVSDISEIAAAAEQGGADGVSLINTILGMAVDIETFKPRLSNIVGGLSGPAIKPAALARVYSVYKRVKIPVIGIGGISSFSDAIEFMLCGAAAVQVGTATFVDPLTSVNMIGDLGAWLDNKGFGSVSDIVGKVKDQ